MKVLILTSLLIILTTGCTNANNEESATNNISTNDSATNPAVEEIIVSHIPASPDVFELTEEEILIYTRFKEELSTSVFEGISPFSIARIHIQAGIDGNWKAEYIMFSEVGRERTLEEWESFFMEETIYVDPNMLADMANSMFSLMQEGIFEQVSDTEAHILFQDIYGETLIFRFIRNNQGIWEVRYNPIDFV